MKLQKWGLIKLFLVRFSLPWDGPASESFFHLEQSIADIDGLKKIGSVHAPEFREWHRATLYMIKSAFGDRTIHYWDFRDVIDEIHSIKLYGFLGVRIITGS